MSDVSSELFFQHVVRSASTGVEGDKIILSISKVFKFDDINLIEVLAATIHKMYHSKVDPSTSLIRLAEGDPRKFGFVDEETFIWKALPHNLKLTYEMPTEHVGEFYFIKDFRGGKDGRVWLCLTEKGNLVVCKLDPDKSYVHEANNWNTIWGPNTAYTTTLYKANALVMSFVFHAYVDNKSAKILFRSLVTKFSSESLTFEDFEKSEVFGEFDESLRKYYDDPMLAAVDALADLAKHKYEHFDLRWRHAGLLPYRIKNKTIGKTTNNNIKWGVKPVLIDLYDVQSSKKKSIDIINEGIRLLRKELHDISDLLKGSIL